MGYQIIELPIIDDLIQEQMSLELELMIILWFINHLDNHWKNREKTCTYDLIKVRYLGEYPALGINYQDKAIEDQEDIVLQEAKSFFNTQSFLDFYQFVLEKKLYVKSEIDKYNKIIYPPDKWNP